MWGVFHVDADEVHVAPMGADEYVAGGHLLTAYCPCDPIRDPHDRRVLIHNEQTRPDSVALN